MKFIKKTARVIKIALSVSLISVALTGCLSKWQTFHIDFGIGKKLEKDWKGTSVQSFESRFGAPTEKTTTNNVTTMKWIASKLHWVSSQLYNQPLGPNMYMRVYKPAHYETANCILAISSEGGIITGVKIISDATIERKSLCQTSFGR
ncbi:hypothetical protein GCM10011491_24510 [Brucella endophytica]|uniref:Lipoprotein n=1 Tax=Brucella endophytica TaxID=1963359 RepID=A0A916SFS9_9HYPH|nr:hypothetical protein GCM10011491_24510 [Brucella endophytica]